jgi:hypothetical protein
VSAGTASPASTTEAARPPAASRPQATGAPDHAPAGSARRRALGCARSRRHRVRERRGELVLQVVVTDEFITQCLDAGFIDEREAWAWDRQALAEVARRMIEDTITNLAITRHAAPSRVLPMLPNTMACTLTAVPQLSGITCRRR